MLNNFFSIKPIDQLIAETDTLAVLSFGEGFVDSTVPARLAALGSSQYTDSALLNSDDDIVEVWKTPFQTVERGRHRDCKWSRSQDYQFVSMAVPFDESSCIEAITEDVYGQLLLTISESEYPQLLRFWNLLPNINHGSGDHENYKRFCNGRLAAFRSFDVSEERFPAASAVGHYVDGLTVYALSAKFQPTNFTNPRQVDAFSYPRKYGPSSPSFARATSVSTKTGDAGDEKDLCFISGTASILGHNTVHKGDLLGQLHTTNDNILYLLKEAGRKRGEIRSLRVFLRNPDDYPQIKSVVDSWYPHAQTIFTHADICRTDLLVEIECFCVAD